MLLLKSQLLRNYLLVDVVIEKIVVGNITFLVLFGFKKNGCCISATSNIQLNYRFLKVMAFIFIV
jgi:hypothetical protein